MAENSSEVIDMVKGKDGRWSIKQEPPKVDVPSAQDRWNALGEKKQQREQSRQQELDRLESDGKKLSGLMYTPEGQGTVASTRQTLTEIVNTTKEGSKPKVPRAHIAEDMAQSAELRGLSDKIQIKWEEDKNNRVEALLKGGTMNSHEITDYLTRALGHKPSLQEHLQSLGILDNFDRLRSDIGRAMIYQSNDTKPAGERMLPVNSPASLKFHNISTQQALESFGRGWDGIKIAAQQTNPGANHV